jgi:mono/diheme cytochrome c family protein
MYRALSLIAAVTVAMTLTSASLAQSDAARGKAALETRAFVPAAWPLSAYDNAWKHWQPPLKQKPANYDAAFRDHYGLAAAPYENNGLPMGLRRGKNLIGLTGLTNDCLLCHGSSIMGKSIVGLGNSSLDIQAFFDELGDAAGAPRGIFPFTFSQVRGTTEAGAFAVYLLSFREPNLNVTFKRHDLGKLRDDLCEDVPAWWLLKKKETMYFTGTSHAKSVRSIMQFMLSPTNPPAVFEREEKTFADIQAYLFSMEAPKYPLPIDAKLAAQGEALFMKSCAKCHGTYGEKPTYPNKIVPIEVIGTDRTRFDGFGEQVLVHYNKSWFAREKGEDGYKAEAPTGYQAPPLDGVWATAPYLHNGSVPTLDGVLNSKARPKIFTRSFRTNREDFDEVNVGWKITPLDKAADPALSGYERRKVYDTTQPGRGNQGHTYGDHFSDAERRAVIEYLKTL